MYVLKQKEENKKSIKELKDGKEDYMAVRLTKYGTTKVVHRNLGESLLRRKLAVEVKAEIESASKVREAKKAKKVSKD